MTRKLLAMLGVAALAGCTSTAAEAPLDLVQTPALTGTTMLVEDLPLPTAASDGDTQLIAANDTLLVDFYGADQLDRTVQVDAKGEIALPLVGSITAAGTSQGELETSIASAYAQDYLQSPVVSVLVKDSVGRRVTVDGEVNRAGIYPVASDATLLQVLAQAGNFSPVANHRQVLVFRPIGEDRFVASFDVAAARSGRGDNPQIFGGDMVVVPSSSMKLARGDLKDILSLAGSAGRLATLGL
jgi:polysaccharide biosynthesis/export protein